LGRFYAKLAGTIAVNFIFLEGIHVLMREEMINRKREGIYYGR